MKKRSNRIFDANTFEHIVPDCITISNDVPVPLNTREKWGFIRGLEINDSFEVGKLTPNYSPKSLGPAAYQIQHKMRKAGHVTFTVTVRTLEGPSDEPITTGCWRTA